MSGNQNRRSGRPGGRGYSGGKGGAAAQTPAGSSSQQPSINPSRSFGKRGTNNNNNGQGPVARQNPSSALSDATSGFAPATPPKGAAPNGSQSHFQPSPNETSNNAPPQSSATNNQPKSLAQIVQQRGPPPKVQNPPMPPLPSKGEQSKGPAPVPLQFGTINIGLMNGLPIPARTNSAPPNLDEQKRNQAMLNAMKASSQATPKPQIPQPRSIPTGTNIGTSTNTNTNTNINTGTNANTNINTGTNANTNINTGTNTNTGTVPVQLPRQPKPQPKPQVHAPAPPAPIPVPISVPVPAQPQPMPVQYQHQHQHQMPVPFQPPPNLQFGAHNSQMQMSLPVGSASQNPQMFLHAQQQAMLHQSQSMGFAGPQPGHQLPPQLGSLGMGPQYPPQQQQQQQGNKFGGARKTTVKITHPDTHEEVRLDNVVRGGVGNVVTGHSGQMQGFPHLGYYPVPSVQAGGYNPQMYFGNPGNMPMGVNQMQTGGPQGPRFPYPVTQSGPPINFMQQGGKPIVSAAASHGHNEGGSVEPALVSRPTVTITNPAVKVSKPFSETSGKNVQAPAASKAPVQAPSAPSVQASSVPPVQAPAVPSVHAPSVPPVQAPSVPAAQAPAVPAVPEEKKKEQPKLELPVSEVTEVTKQAQIVVTKDEDKPNGTNKAPVLAKPEPTVQSKIDEEKPVKAEPKPEKAQQQEEKPFKTEAKAEKTQQEEEKPVKTEAKGEKTQQEKPSKSEAKPEKAQQENPSKTEEKPEKTQQEVEEKPVKTEQEKKNDEAPAGKVSEKESEKPSLEAASKQAEEITEEEKKRPNSATSSISTDSESLSSGPSTHMNGNSSKPDTKGVLGAPKDNNKPKDINNSNNNKPFVEVQKRPGSSKKKKKIKEILSKADAAGSSDLYNAYKGPEERTTEIVEITEEVKTEAPVVNNDNNNNNASEEESGANKAELDDWEDVADITTPKSPPKPQVIIPTKKKYTRDFLLTFRHQCTELPQGFNSDPGIDSILTGGGYGGGNRSGFDQTYPSPGRGGRGNDRRLVNSGSFNAGQLDDDRWGKSPGSFTPSRDMGNNYNINNQVPNLMNLRPGSSNYAMKYPRGQGGNNNQFMGGILSPMPAQGGPHRTGSDMDRWQHVPGGSQRGLIPSPVASPHQQMHKAENKYLVGKVSDEEEAKQRRLKGILNKLTPQNFDRLFEQVKEVNIDNPTTLAGVISQIFDKALMEPTFCEMYANFCSQLATALPDFSENNEKITFKRLLLNKCQEEFERGEREEAEAAKEEEGELKQTPEEREEKRIKSRRRMLGNIRLIGELYKKRMLTERIMHECIKKLLGPTQNPDEEDIEALCKLMSTIGEMIDHVKAKEHMDAYFDLMLKLSNNQKYSSRVRFMLKDTMDLRKNRWQQRRKVEGPKKIEDVHRDAANERQAQTTRLSRGGPIMNNPPSMRRTGAGTALISPQQQGGIIRGMAPSNRMQQDIRYEERGGDRYQFDNNSRNQNVNVPLLRREESLTLGPQGGLGRGMSIRGQGQPPILSLGPSGSNGSRLASPDERSGPGLGGWSSSRNLERNFSAGSSTSRTVPVHVPVPSPQAVVPPVPAVSQSGGAGLPDNVVKEKSISAIREYFSARSEEEVKLCIADMKSPGSYQLIISTWINDSFERKELERDLTYKLLISLCNPKQGVFTQSHLLRGIEGVLSTLEDAVNDAPKAPEYLGQLFAKSITEGLTSLKDIGTIVLQGGEDPGMLIEAGIGGDVIGCVLESVRKDKGEGFLGEVRAKSELNLEEFKPAAPMRSKKLDPFL